MSDRVTRVMRSLQMFFSLSLREGPEKAQHSSFATTTTTTTARLWLVGAQRLPLRHALDGNMPTAATARCEQQPVQHQAQATPHAVAPAAAAAAAGGTDVLLCDEYARMAACFAQSGLDLQAVAAAAAWFDTGVCPPQPLHYASPRFPPAPLPPGAVRLLLVPLAAQPAAGGDAAGGAGSQGHCTVSAAEGSAGAEASPESAAVLDAADTVAQSVLQLLPAGCQVFVNPLEGLHVTVFHFSHPLDTRPDTLAAAPPTPAASDSDADSRGDAAGEPAAAWQEGSDAASSSSSSSNDGSCHDGRQRQQQVLALPPHLRPAPTPRQLVAEETATLALVAATQPFTLQLERVVLARSGTLLLTWLEPSGRLVALRKRLAATFAGGSSRQSSIIHTSVARIVVAAGAGGDAAARLRCGCSSRLPSGEQQQHAGRCAVCGGNGCQQQQQLPPGVVAAVSDACEALTQRLRGLQLRVSLLHWLAEQQFSTVAGQAVAMRLGAMQ